MAFADALIHGAAVVETGNAGLSTAEQFIINAMAGRSTGMALVEELGQGQATGMSDIMHTLFAESFAQNGGHLVTQDPLPGVQAQAAIDLGFSDRAAQEQGNFRGGGFVME